jgi:hypothetical protein
MNNTGKTFPENLTKKSFSAFAIESGKDITRFEGYNKYYKIIFISGPGEIRSKFQLYRFDGPILLFTLPDTHYWLTIFSMTSRSYVCRFNNDFTKNKGLDCLKKKENYFSSNPVLMVEQKDEEFIESIFRRLTEEQTKMFKYKSELAGNKISILTHLALRMSPLKNKTSLATNSPYLRTVSLELLELGFPRHAQTLHFN